MSRLSIEVTPEFHHAIEAMAMERGVSLHDLVVERFADANKYVNSGAGHDDCSLCEEYGGKNRKLKTKSANDMKIVGTYKTTKEMFSAMGIELGN